jgi:hypothetical protein
MSRFVGIYMAAFMLAFGPVPLPARVQDESSDLCWSPDHEWPVPCDDEG